MEESIFTKIINGDIPSYKIYEDDRAVAFLDIHPLSKGHTLVVPKTQVDHLWDLSDDDYSYIWNISKKIAKQLQDKLGSKRISVRVEGFAIPHAHIHLVPMDSEEEIRVTSDFQTSPEDLASLVSSLQIY